MAYFQQQNINFSLIIWFLNFYFIIIRTLNMRSTLFTNSYVYIIADHRCGVIQQMSIVTLFISPETWCPLLGAPQFSLPLVPRNHPSTLGFYEFDYFQYLRSEIMQYLSFCDRLISLSLFHWFYLFSGFIHAVAYYIVSFLCKAY